LQLTFGEVQKVPILQGASKDAPGRNCNFLMDDFIIHQKNNKSYEAPLGAKNDLAIFCKRVHTVGCAYPALGP
jgi:hypothetical protein